MLPPIPMYFPSSLCRFGASILVEDQSTYVAFGHLAFNPQCFIMYEDPTIPPGHWNNVRRFTDQLFQLVVAN